MNRFMKTSSWAPGLAVRLETAALSLGLTEAQGQVPKPNILVL